MIQGCQSDADVCAGGGGETTVHQMTETLGDVLSDHTHRTLSDVVANSTSGGGSTSGGPAITGGSISILVTQMLDLHVLVLKDGQTESTHGRTFRSCVAQGVRRLVSDLCSHGGSLRAKVPSWTDGDTCALFGSKSIDSTARKMLICADLQGYPEIMLSFTSFRMH